MQLSVSQHFTNRCTNLLLIVSSNPLFASNLRTRASHSSHTPKDVVFSGIQPTGVPHVGNYLGALQQWVRMQNQAPVSTQFLYSIVDLHAITTRQNADQLRRWKQETLATLLAIGLDPKRSTIFYQSAVCPCLSIDGRTSSHIDRSQSIPS